MSRMLPKPLFTMKTTPFIAVVFSLVFLASCTKDSLYPVDMTAEAYIESAHLQSEKSKGYTEVLMNATGDTTIQLHVVSSSLNVSQGTYTITFENELDMSGKQPQAEQSLDFENSQGQSVFEILDLIGFTVGSSTLEIVFDATNQQFSGLSLDAVQVIGVEDIAVN